MVGWSADELARLLELYRSMENKTADSLKERVEATFLARATNFLTAVKGVNKTDVVTLLSAFGNIKNIVAASEEELSVIPGFGRTKARKLYKAFRQPFMVEE
jgi:DNA excision repair protein ERCC-1